MTDTAEQETEVQPPFVDEMAEMSFNLISKLINERNLEVGKINAVKGDRVTLSETLKDNSTDPAAVAAREARDAAQEAFDTAENALHAAIQPELEQLLSNVEGSTTELEESVKALDGKIKPATTFFKKMYDPEGNGLVKFLPHNERLKGFSTKGSGAGGRRVRGFWVTVTVDGDATTYENLASAAKALDVPTATLQGQFFEAGGNKETLKEIDDVVEWELSYVEVSEDGSENTVTAQLVAERQTKEDDATE